MPMQESDVTFPTPLRKPERIAKIRNLTDKKFGRLFAVKLLGMTDDSKRRAVWLFQCDCGQLIAAVGNDVSAGNTNSCGCYFRERMKETFTTHGMRRSREYKKHSNMMSRCFDPNNIQAKDYSERGITVCEYLKDFSNFFKELGPLPSRAYSTDRIDNDGNYSCGHCEQCITNGWPKNVRWATRTQQAGNKRNSHLITIDGETHHLAEWCRRAGKTHATVIRNLQKGYSPEQALGFKERPIREGHGANGKFLKGHQPHNLKNS
jgi:hypothetical protein